MGAWPAVAERGAAAAPLTPTLVEDYDGDTLWRWVVAYGEPRARPRSGSKPTPTSAPSTAAS